MRASTLSLLFACAATAAPPLTQAPAPVAAAAPAPDPAAAVDGPRAWVGVKFEPSTRRIDRVFEGSPADKAGLHAGDEIVSLDGSAIATSRDFITRVADAKVGAQLTVVVTRAGQALTAKLVLAVRPEMEALARRVLLDRPAPKFAALTPLAGHVVVLDFWATWCGPCQGATEPLNELQKKYPSVRVLALTSDSDAEIKDWVYEHKAEYPIVRDPGDAIAGAYAVQALPTLVVIDRAGKVRQVEVGLGDFHDLEALVARLVTP